MPRVAFADESGTHANPKCYAIGVVSVQADHLSAFNAVFHRLRREHGVAQELHWTSVNKGHGLINLGIHWLSQILRSQTARFDAIVVNTALYRKWQERKVDREAAFYMTYTYLLRHIARQVSDTTHVFIDDRSDSYDKHTEALETISNRMLSQLQTQGRLENVTKVKSHDYPGVQVADFLTGAIASSHQLLLDPKTSVNLGKRVAIARLSRLLGWDALHYDTFPHSKFNIWHFPIEYRGHPESRSVRAASLVPFVRADDLQGARLRLSPRS